MSIEVISWNVNGIRAAQKKGLYDWFAGTSPDVLCLQETKAQTDQLDECFLDVAGYHSYWMSAEKKGYSGVAVYTRDEPESVDPLGAPEFDAEGRTCIVTLPELTVVNCYFPNSQPEGRRLEYKLDFCAAVLDTCRALASEKRRFVLCGDFNIAHRPIDLARPKENEANPGYLPEERGWMDAFLEAGFLDTFRLYCDEPGHYTWWSYIGRAREKNIGWRLDYHCVPDYMRDVVAASEIQQSVMGSDHCPVLIRLDL